LPKAEAGERQMILTREKIVLLVIAITAFLITVDPCGARAEAPVKLLIEGQFGATINLGGANFCLGSECNPDGGEASPVAGGFDEFSPNGVAVAPNGNIYAADDNYQRVQELTATGEFVLMFGKDVNETTGGNICTEAEVLKAAVKCKAGVAGSEPGEFNEPEAIAIDPTSGNVYVGDLLNARVQEFTDAGEFVLAIGKGVNATTGGNLCTAASGDVCQAGSEGAIGSTEHSSFRLPQKSGDDLVVGGPQDLLYVGDEHRIQEFKSDGTWVEDIELSQLSSTENADVRALALNQASGEIYTVYYGPEASPQLRQTIFAFDANGSQIHQFILKPKMAGEGLEIEGMALDSAGRLAVTADEGESVEFGSLLDSETGRAISGFSVPFSTGKRTVGTGPGMAFNSGTVQGGDERLYLVSPHRREVVGYSPEAVGELITGSLACEEEGEKEAAVTLGCELSGQLDPEGVPETESFFLWSNTEEALEGSETYETPRQSISTGNILISVPRGMITGLRPNERIYYELSGFDELVQTPESLAGEEITTFTSLTAPRIVGAPTVEFVKSSSVVMQGVLDPENAKTEYFFEYGPGEALAKCEMGVRHEICPGVETSTSAESDAYRKLPTTLEATGLQPGTLYHFRLYGESENATAGERRTSLEANTDSESEGEFTTGPAPIPQAETGSYSGVGTTSATISGMVDPAGQSAIYRFEVGVYDGALTHYGIVLSGSAGASVSPTEKKLVLAGLQPGITYAYRILIESGYGTVYGATATFTTVGVPEVLVQPAVLSQLPVPGKAFPKEPVPPKKLTRGQLLTNALKACLKERRVKRAVCRRDARRRYTATSKKAVRTKGRRTTSKHRAMI
jgi:hypothetical protein